MMTNMKKIALLFFVFFTAHLFAQNTAAISGKVTDEKSNALKAVTVHLLNTNISVLQMHRAIIVLIIFMQENILYLFLQ